MSNDGQRVPTLVCAIPHFYGARRKDQAVHGSNSDRAERRAKILYRTVMQLHQTFGQTQAMMQLARCRTDAANTRCRMKVKVIVATVDHQHLIAQANMPTGAMEHIVCDCAPEFLGFECHRLMTAQQDHADWFLYLEDDLLMHDPFYFAKLNWFIESVGSDATLQPNRFEKDDRMIACKAYVDGDLRERATDGLQDRSHQSEVNLDTFGQTLRFVRPSNPHAGCFALRLDQLRHWEAQPNFGKPTRQFIGPLESAASIGLMQTFRVYKPAIENAGFLEVEHQSKQFIRQLRQRG